MTTTTDRYNGLVGSVAIKPPVRVATTANITLSGLQTIDGVVLAESDRVLVKNQTNAVENGIYVASLNAWSRATDFNGAFDASGGTLISIRQGTVNTNLLYSLTTASPVIGTSELIFSTLLPYGGEALLGVENVATLRTTEPSFDGQVVTLLGHTVDNIGEGQFFHDASDTTTADDNGLTIVTTGGKRWKRQKETVEYNPEWFGGIVSASDNTTAIQNTINACFNAGGGVVLFPAGTWLASRITVMRTVILDGGATGSAILKQISNSNQDFIISENFATLTLGGLRVSDSSLVPYWFGLKDILVDGNKANQTSGRGVAFYGAAQVMKGNVVVYNCFDDGIYTEYTDVTGSTDWKGQEEGQFDNITTRDNGGKGWLFRGPHNSRINAVIAQLNGDWGFYAEVGTNYDGLFDVIGLLHPYQNGDSSARKGAYFGAGGYVTEHILDGCGSEVNITATGQSLLIGVIRGGSVGYGRDAFKVTAGNVIVNTTRLPVSANATNQVFLNFEGGKAIFNSVWIFGNSNAGLTAVRVNSNYNQISNLYVENFNGAGSKALDLSNSNAYSAISGTIINCTQALDYSGGSNNKLDLSIETSSGQVAVSSTKPTLRSVFNITSSGDTIGSTSNMVLSDTFSLETVGVVSVTVPHGLLYTPDLKNVNPSITDAAPDDYETGYVRVSAVDATNVTIAVKITVASVNVGATARLGVWFDVSRG
jgi:hypothetical protein